MFRAFSIKNLSYAMVHSITVAVCGNILVKTFDVFGGKSRIDLNSAYELFDEVNCEYIREKTDMMEICDLVAGCNEVGNMLNESIICITRFFNGLRQYVLFVSEGRHGWYKCDWIIKMMKSKKSVDEMMANLSDSFTDNLFENAPFINQGEIRWFMIYLHVLSMELSLQELEEINAMISRK